MLEINENDWIFKMDKYDKENLSEAEIISLFDLNKLSEEELRNLCSFRGLYYNLKITENNNKLFYNEDVYDKDEEDRCQKKSIYLEEIIDNFYYTVEHREKSANIIKNYMNKINNSEFLETLGVKNI